MKLSPDFMTPYSEYYVGKIIEYKILELPRFGSIRSGKSSKINRFTQKQLEAGVVQYIHSGTEDHFDSMKLVAFGKNKESLPFTLSIEVQPVNDEVPIVTTNTGLQMWIGGKSVLKITDLSKFCFISLERSLNKVFFIRYSRLRHAAREPHLLCPTSVWRLFELQKLFQPENSQLHSRRHKSRKHFLHQRPQRTERSSWTSRVLCQRWNSQHERADSLCHEQCCDIGS